MELVTAMFVGCMLIITITVIFSTGMDAWKHNIYKVRYVENAQAALDTLIKDISCAAIYFNSPSKNPEEWVPSFLSVTPEKTTIESKDASGNVSAKTDYYFGNVKLWLIQGATATCIYYNIGGLNPRKDFSSIANECLYRAASPSDEKTPVKDALQQCVDNVISLEFKFASWADIDQNNVINWDAITLRSWDSNHLDAPEYGMLPAAVKIRIGMRYNSDRAYDSPGDTADPGQYLEFIEATVFLRNSRNY